MAAGAGARRTKAASCRSGRLAAVPAWREGPARPASRGSSGVYRNGPAAPRDMPGLQLAWPMQARATRPQQRRPMASPAHSLSCWLAAQSPPLRPTAPAHGHAAAAKAAAHGHCRGYRLRTIVRGARRRPFSAIATAGRVVAGCITSLPVVACRAVLLPLQHHAPVEVPGQATSRVMTCAGMSPTPEHPHLHGGVHLHHAAGVRLRPRGCGQQKHPAQCRCRPATVRMRWPWT